MSVNRNTSSADFSSGEREPKIRIVSDEQELREETCGTKGAPAKALFEVRGFWMSPCRYQSLEYVEGRNLFNSSPTSINCPSTVRILVTTVQAHRKQTHACASLCPRISQREPPLGRHLPMLTLNHGSTKPPKAGPPRLCPMALTALDSDNLV